MFRVDYLFVPSLTCTCFAEQCCHNQYDLNKVARLFDINIYNNVCGFFPCIVGTILFYSFIFLKSHIVKKNPIIYLTLKQKRKKKQLLKKNKKKNKTQL